MKKIWSLCLVLCLLMGLVCNVSAVPETKAPETTAATDSTETTETEPTEPIPQGTAPDVPYGSASITSGCRGIDAQVPLGGSEKFLKTTQSAFVYEQNTGTVIYAFEPDKEVSPGSLAKVLTAIVAIERGKMDDAVTISTAHYNTLPAGALNAKLKQGEVISLEDLLYCMMLGSANDAAISIAEHIAGSESDFATMMNQKAQEIGCTNSVFVNAHGLDVASQHTTARDMAKIVQYAVQNETFVKIFGETKHTVPETNRSDARTIISDNYLIEKNRAPKFNDKRVTGGKTSATAASGASLVCTADSNDMKMICVLMGAKREYLENGYTVKYFGNFEEILELLKFSYDRYKFCQLYFEGQAMKEFPVANGTNNIVGGPKNSRNAILPIKAGLEHLFVRYEVRNGGLTAPVKKGDQIATVQFWYQNSCVAETELYAMSEVRSTSNPGVDIQNAATRDDSNLKDILFFIGIIFLILLIPFSILLIIRTVRRAAVKKRRRLRRKSRRRSR